MINSTCIICLDTIDRMDYISSRYDMYNIYMVFNNNNNNNRGINTAIGHYFLYNPYPYYWKPCKCKINAHPECIHHWYSHRPICLYCKTSVYNIQYILMMMNQYYPTVKKIAYDVFMESTSIFINCITVYAFIDTILYTINCR